MSRPFAVTEQDAAHRLATAQLVSRAGDTSDLLDLLFSLIRPRAGDLRRAAKGIEVQPNLVVPAAKSEHLLALKCSPPKIASALRTRGDIAVLLRRMDEPGIHSTCNALRLIQARGYNRCRDLVSLLESVRRGFL